MKHWLHIFSALFAVGILAASDASAQKTISVGGNACADALQGLAEVIIVDITYASPPRRFAEKCVARKVRAASSDGKLVLDFAKVTWGYGELADISSGSLPRSLTLELSGSRVHSFPRNEPFWRFIQDTASSSGGVDGMLAFSFKRDTGEIGRLLSVLNFSNNNAISVSANLANVSGSLPQNPKLYGMVLTTREVSLSVQGSRNFGRNIVEMIVASMPEKSRPTAGSGGVRGLARGLFEGRLRSLVSPASRASVAALLDQLPDPAGKLDITLSAQDGFGFLHALTLLAAAEPKAALPGVEIAVAYDPGALSFGGD